MNPKAIDDMGMAMADVYAAVTDRILINLAHHFPYVQTNRHIGSWEYQTMMLAQMGKVEKETIAIIAQSLGGADEALKQALETAILQGLKNEEPKLRQAAMNGLLKPNGYVPELDPSQLQAFTAYYRQSADKLNLVNTVMLDSTKQAYQATVADVAQKIANTQGILNAAAGEVITGVSTWNGAMHSAVQKMVANGITGFIDHAGHKWSPEAYVAMDIKTTMFNTARAAVWERSEQYGSDLYQVSSHNAARPLCYPWQGKVISTSGRTGTTFDIDGNEVVIHSQDEIESFRYGGGLFGVNCGHYPMAFIPNFSSLKGEPQDQAENDKQYAETQQQRALERRLREEKRDLEVMKAQGAPAEQIKAQREKVRSASADIDEFCDKTGLPRRRNREYTPINATFPDTVPPISPMPPIQPPLPPSVAPPMQRIRIGDDSNGMDYGEVFDDNGYRKPQLKQFAKAKETLDNAPDNVKQAWSKSAPRLKKPEFGADGSADAYYSPARNKTHFKTYKKAFEESTYQRENVTFFHEYGHNIDRVIGNNGKWLSQTYTNAKGENFYTVIQRDCGNAMSQFYLHDKGYKDAYEAVKAVQNGTGGMGFGSYIRQSLRATMPSDEYRAIRSMLLDAGDDDSVLRPLAEKWLKNTLESDLRSAVGAAGREVGTKFASWVKETYNIYERSDISDMFEHYTLSHCGIQYPFGVGHGRDYASNMDNVPLETFAEMYSATVTQNDSLPVIKQFFPESYAMFEDMIRSVIE